MGGTALGKQLPRLSRNKYFEIVADLKGKLQNRYFLFVQEPRSFPAKVSFGDVDLLVTGQQQVMEPTKDLGAKSAITNGNIISMEYLGHQVDLIKIPDDRIDLSLFFYGYGDIGMIIGMLARNIGLKFGMKHLTLKLETYKIKLSHELKEILRFLGLDYSAWEKGFATEGDIFAWLISCKYFRPSFFAHNAAKLREDEEKKIKSSISFEEPVVWNSEARTRMSQRPMFRNFIIYVSTLPMNSDRVDRHDVRSDALDFFNKREEHTSIERHLAVTRRVKAKFNGKLAMQWTNNAIQGKALGEVIAAFRTNFTMERLDSMSIARIENAFVDFADTRPFTNLES